MLNRKVISLVMVLQLIAPVVMACAYCDYSPNNWGFCKFGADVGFYDCETVVADPFSGRTRCEACGYCNGFHPYLNQPCDAGDGDCGLDPTNPCDQSLKAPQPGQSCGSPARITSGNDLNWIDARIDQVAIF